MNNKKHYAVSKGLNLNYFLILDIIEKNSKILDLGCGNGYLLKLLKDKKNIKGNGIEILQDEVIKCIEKGLSVIQGNMEEILKGISNKFYDYVILNQTLQTINNPELVINEMLRVGKKCIISFPNFAYWKVKFNYFFKGYMPKSRILPFEWYNTPNIHLLTIKDFYKFSKKHNFKILKQILTTKISVKNNIFYKLFSNFLAEEAIFIITQDN